MRYTQQCPDCGSTDTAELCAGVLECGECRGIFEDEDEPPVAHRRHRKTRWHDDDEG